MPISLHVVTSKKGNREKKNTGQRPPANVVRASRQSVYMRLIHEVQESITDIILGGVLERFPKLLIVSAENDTGWLPHYMYRADHAWGEVPLF